MSWWSRLANVVRSARLDRGIWKTSSAFTSKRAPTMLKAQGLSRQAALAQASRQFGHRLLLRESSRDVKLLPWVESLGRDFRLGLACSERMRWCRRPQSSRSGSPSARARRLLADRRADPARVAGPRPTSPRISEPRGPERGATSDSRPSSAIRSSIASPTSSPHMDAFSLSLPPHPPPPPPPSPLPTSPPSLPPHPPLPLPSPPPPPPLSPPPLFPPLLPPPPLPPLLSLPPPSFPPRRHESHAGDRQRNFHAPSICPASARWAAPLPTAMARRCPTTSSVSRPMFATARYTAR